MLSSSALVSVIEIIKEHLAHRRARKDLKEDRAEQNAESRLAKLEKKIDAVYDGQKYLMYDHIKTAANQYKKDKQVDFDDRRMLHLMHGCYHNGLGGNGDLDLLMQEVDELPLKEE